MKPAALAGPCLLLAGGGIDPEHRLVIVLWSNRVHPTRNNPRWAPIRAAVADRVVAALHAEGVTH